MVFFVHFLVAFAVLCLGTAVGVVRLVVARRAQAPRAVPSTPAIAPLPRAVAIAAPRPVRTARLAPRPVTPHEPLPVVSVEFTDREATWVDAEPTRVWSPPERGHLAMR